MLFRRFAPILILLCCACTTFPNNNPGEEIFTEKDFAVWNTGSSEVPQDLVGTWRVIEQAGSQGVLTLWYQFNKEGIFAIGSENYFRTGQGKAEWEGAFRKSDKQFFCHYQRKNGDDNWINTQGGKGMVKNFPYVFNDADTLVLGNQSSQNLTIKYKRVNIKPAE
jgi:hypothetical protein